VKELKLEMSSGIRSWKSEMTTVWKELGLSWKKVYFFSKEKNLLCDKNSNFL
jgi:hypothetical protein